MNVGEYYLLLGCLIAIPCLVFVAWVKHQDKKKHNTQKRQ